MHTGATGRHSNQRTVAFDKRSRGGERGTAHASARDTTAAQGTRGTVTCQGFSGSKAGGDSRGMLQTESPLAFKTLASGVLKACRATVFYPSPYRRGAPRSELGECRRGTAQTTQCLDVLSLIHTTCSWLSERSLKHPQASQSLYRLRTVYT